MVTADFRVNGVAAGENLASKFKLLSQGVWELKLAKPITDFSHAQLVVSVKDRQGKVNRIERFFTIGKSAAPVQQAKHE